MIIIVRERNLATRFVYGKEYHFLRTGQLKEFIVQSKFENDFNGCKGIYIRKLIGSWGSNETNCSSCCDGGNETHRNFKPTDVLSVILTSKRIFQVSELLRKYRTF